jgi:hypothetical protein
VFGYVGITISLLDENVTVLHYHNDGASDVGLLESIRNKPIQPSFQIWLSKLCGGSLCDTDHQRCAYDYTKRVMQWFSLRKVFNHSHRPGG